MSDPQAASAPEMASAAAAVARDTRRVLAGRSMVGNLSARVAGGLARVGLGQANMVVRPPIAAQM
ncbi:hypothetical protein IFM12276_22580 [Nocardia sputorum]|uniref:Uncharacterized protein n=1 Tax=Nocardia sputorum TaxID=2984338 RepID=A0ABM8CW69_9NOCA|nr:hypothetical protein IFM12276_22580 [Nocardia sputorum]